MTERINPAYVELLKYYQEEYGDIWPSMIGVLERIAYTGPKKESKREYVLTSFGFAETVFDFEYFHGMVRDALVGKIKSPLTLEQGKEFLRTYRLILMFDQVYNNESPDDDEEFKKFCLNHPLWHRLEKQAKKTLETLKKKKGTS